MIKTRWRTTKLGFEGWISVYDQGRKMFSVASQIHRTCVHDALEDAQRLASEYGPGSETVKDYLMANLNSRHLT